jgi:hypothetical protein
LISVICDNALVSGFAADCRPVGSQIVEDVCRDFDLVSALGSVPAVVGAKVKTAPVVQPVAVEKPVPKKAGGERSLFEHFSIRRRFSLF